MSGLVVAYSLAANVNILTQWKLSFKYENMKILHMIGTPCSFCATVNA